MRSPEGFEVALSRRETALLKVLLANPRIPLTREEIAAALAGAAEAVSGEHGADLKKRMRTGTVVTTDDRNWELRFTQSAKRMSLSRAVGVDMESATIAGQGYRFRVPYGTLLCVSDKPLHGEIKLRTPKDQFKREFFLFKDRTALF